MYMVPGDASRDVHEPCVSPWDCPSCRVGWQKDTYMLIFEGPDVFPTPSWQAGRFPAAWHPVAEPGDSRHSHFQLHTSEARAMTPARLCADGRGARSQPPDHSWRKIPVHWESEATSCSSVPGSGTSGVQTSSFLGSSGGEACSSLKVSEETAHKYCCLRSVTVHVAQTLK